MDPLIRRQDAGRDPSLRLDRAVAPLLAAALWAMAPSTAFAQGHEHAAAGATGDCHRRRHSLMVMAAPGLTDAGATTFSAAVGYEYRLPLLGDVLGVGGMAEVMFAPALHPMLMAHVSLHPFGGLFVQTALGVTHVHGQPERPNATTAILRLSAGYDFHLGRFMLTPYANADFSETPRIAVAAGLGAGIML